MFIEKGETKLRLLIKDPVARLLFLNALFVIVSYALFNFTGGISSEFVRIFKNVFLFVSLVYLIVTNRVTSPRLFFDSAFTPVIFGILTFYMSIGVGNFVESLVRTATFFIPFIYIYLSLTYLVSQFGTQVTLKGLHYAILIIYCLPLIVYVLQGGSIKETNIYGQGEDQFFVSNNYGWSATLYILSYLFVWKDIKLKRIPTIFFAALLPIAIILLIVSANRASWLSMSVAIIPFFFTYKKLRFQFKILAILVVFAYVAFLYTDPNSSINFVAKKSLLQEKNGESRFETAALVVDYFNSEPTHWLTGIGMFNFSVIRNKSKLSSYHNSYYEILFGAGIPLFLVFLSFMFFRPLLRFIKYYLKYTLLLPPLMILPFFESDLTAGQFLFFPWFVFMLLLNAKPKFWNKETFRATFKKSEIFIEPTFINETDHPIL